MENSTNWYFVPYSSKSGKTAVLKFAMPVWGDPKVLVSKYFSTIVGMERWAGTLKHLPYAMDELQTLNQKKLSVNDIVYTLGNGSGKTRGRVGSGLQKVETWRNCILSTGEQPMATDNSMDGVNTILMEIYAAPLTKSLCSISADESAAPAVVVNPATPEFVPLSDDYDTIVVPDDEISADNVNTDPLDAFAQQLHQVSEFMDNDIPEERDTAMFMNLVLMSKCAELWVFGDNISAGMKSEIDRAKHKHMIIRYFTEEFEETT